MWGWKNREVANVWLGYIRLGQVRFGEARLVKVFRSFTIMAMTMTKFAEHLIESLITINFYQTYWSKGKLFDQLAIFFFCSDWISSPNLVKSHQKCFYNVKFKIYWLLFLYLLPLESWRLEQTWIFRFERLHWEENFFRNA